MLVARRQRVGKVRGSRNLCPRGHRKHLVKNRSQLHLTWSQMNSLETGEKVCGRWRAGFTGLWANRMRFGNSRMRLWFLPLSVYLEIYGCQMNVSDADIAWTFLSEAGYLRTDSVEEASDESTKMGNAAYIPFAEIFKNVFAHWKQMWNSSSRQRIAVFCSILLFSQHGLYCHFSTFYYVLYYGNIPHVPSICTSVPACYRPTWSWQWRVPLERMPRGRYGPDWTISVASRERDLATDRLWKLDF